MFGAGYPGILPENHEETMQTQAVRSKEYETIYILRPDVDGETAERVQARVSEVIGRESGTMVKVEQWGRRKLAYPVAKQRKGVYVYVKYVGRGSLVGELERNLKIIDSVMKFQTVVTNHAIDSTTLVVDPEEVKFQKLELEPDTEEAESRERSLGLVEPSPDAPRHRAEEEDPYADGAEEESPVDSKKEDAVN